MPTKATKRVAKKDDPKAPGTVIGPVLTSSNSEALPPSRVTATSHKEAS